MLADCVRSLEQQSFRDFEIIVVDNSGENLVRTQNLNAAFRIIENGVNAGFGGALNQAAEASASRYIATLNDDAVAHPGWLASLVAAMEADPRAGMCASQVLLHPQGTVDSAGMLIGGDGSSKQRGYGQSAGNYARSEPALLPSGSGAMYRRAMFTDIGGFDRDFFLYCEDTDLGLRARWAGWECLYVAEAVVEHRYSQSAGRASSLKAYYVERNRIAVAIKNFPAPLLLRAPFVTAARYFWHLLALLRGTGAAADFHAGSNAFLLPWFVIRAHAAALFRLPSLLAKRRQIRKAARISSEEFRKLLRANYISARQVASL